MLPESVRRLFRLDRGRRGVPDDVDEELRFHLEEKARALIARGMDPEAARLEARRQFGSVQETSEALVVLGRLHAARRQRADRLEGIRQDVKLALRGFAREPALVAAIVTMLGLGIGGAAAMFGLLDRLLLRVGPHIAAPHELRRIYVNEYDAYFTKARVFRSGFLADELQLIREALPDTPAIASMVPWRDRLGGRGGPMIPIALTSGDAFRVLGTRPEAGRLLEPSDDAPAAPPAAVISHGLWQRHFGGDPSVVGRTLDLGPVRYTIAGVAPRGFAGLRPDRIDAWVPVAIGAPAHYGPHWRQSARMFDAVLRVGPRSDPRTLGFAAQRALRSHAELTRRDDTAAVATLEAVTPYKRPGPTGARTRLSLIVAGVAAILCLIAVANATNLLLLRNVRRQHETAVRIALGVARARLIRAVVIESLLLAIGGAAAAGLVARWGGELLRRLIVRVEWQQGIVDPRVLVFAGALALLIGLVTGLVPGWLSSRPEGLAALKAGVRVSGTRSRLRAGLLVFQAALTVTLMAGLGLYARSFLKARSEDYGVAADRLVNVNVSAAPEDSLAAPASLANVTAELADRVRLVPGVAGVAQASIAPIYGYGGALLRAEGVDSIQMDQHGPFITEIDTAFLAVTGLRLLRGRAFTAVEVATHAPVALVNDALAGRLWPGLEPIGKCLYVGFRSEPVAALCRVVVGVVGSYRNRLGEDAPMQNYYLPLGYRWREGPRGGHAIVVRTSVPPAKVVPVIFAVLRERLPHSDPEAVRAIDDIVQRQLDPWRAGTTLFGLFAALAVMLAMAGLYALVAYSVAQRSHEFGIRIAVGAQSADLVRLVLATALSPVTAGLVLGLGLTLWLVRYLGPLLYETSPRDPLVLAAAVLLLLSASAAACVGPARTATRTDPRIALQAE